jgi:hypothetical protein
VAQSLGALEGLEVPEVLPQLEPDRAELEAARSGGGFNRRGGGWGRGGGGRGGRGGRGSWGGRGRGRR